MTAKKSIDWAKIKAEYLTENISYRELAEKYGVSLTAVSSRARKGNWVEQRKKRKEKISRKIVEEVNNKEIKDGAKALINARDISKKLLQAIDRAADELDIHILHDTTNTSYTTEKRVAKSGKEIPPKTILKSKQRLRTQKSLIKTKAVKELASALNDVAALLNTGNEEENEYGVILIPQQEELTPPSEDRKEEEQNGEKVREPKTGRL